MESQVLHTVWCNIAGEATGEIWNWSFLGVRGLKIIRMIMYGAFWEFLYDHSLMHACVESRLLFIRMTVTDGTTINVLLSWELNELRDAVDIKLKHRFLFAPSNPSYYQVRLGEHNRNVNEGTEQTIPARRIFRHPDYNTPSPINNDIALIHLARPATLNSRVQTVCLPSHDYQVPTSSRCYITGESSWWTGDRETPARVNTAASPEFSVWLALQPLLRR